MEREGGGTRKGGGDCVRPYVLYVYDRVCTFARTHIHTRIRKHTDTWESTRKLEYVRMSVRAKEGSKRHVEGWQRVAGKLRGRLRGNVGR